MLESMKMENTIAAPRDGVVSQVTSLERIQCNTDNHWWSSNNGCLAKGS